MGSPSEVPVPCISSAAMQDGCTSPAASAARMTWRQRYQSALSCAHLALHFLHPVLHLHFCFLLPRSWSIYSLGIGIGSTSKDAKSQGERPTCCWEGPLGAVRLLERPS